MRSSAALAALAALLALLTGAAPATLEGGDEVAVLEGKAVQSGRHHHHHRHHRHHKHRHHHAKKSLAKPAANATNATNARANATNARSNATKASLAPKSFGKAPTVVNLAERSKQQHAKVERGVLEVNGPLPPNFAEGFAVGAARAAGCKPSQVKVVDAHPVKGRAHIMEVTFEAPGQVVRAVEEQASVPDSRLATGILHDFLVERVEARIPTAALSSEEEPAPATPVKDTGIDVDTAMPYGELEPFGREDTAQELTQDSVKESDQMVDQLERAEVAEEKRSVFRALTRLRGAAIASFDGVARSQTGNIDQYSKEHKWRSTHPLHHLAAEESDITKWAFPANADF